MGDYLVLNWDENSVRMLATYLGKSLAKQKGLQMEYHLDLHSAVRSGYQLVGLMAVNLD